MKKNDDREFILVVLAAVLIITGVGVLGAWFSASYEAAAFNRLTGGSATTWDALWVDLRVIGHEQRMEPQ